MSSPDLNFITREYIDRMLYVNLEKVRFEARLFLRPTTNQTVSEWADENRILPETSAEPGKWRTSRAPHSKGIMDAASKAGVKQITYMKSAQCAGTEIINNIVGYFIDCKPCSIMIMQPTDNDARDYSGDKLEPMLQDTPVLRRKVRKTKRVDAASKLKKKFIGGWLRIVSGNTTSSTRQRSAKLTIGDDIDAIEIGKTREGDPVTRLMKRSTTFPDRLNINVSTPGRINASRISALYDQSSKGKFFVVCPHCNSEFYFKHERLVWKKDLDMFGKPIRQYAETAVYVCDNCDHEINEYERLTILQSGYWKHERPWITWHLGFWSNELSSTLSSFKAVAQSIIDAGDDPDKLEALWNLVFGLPYDKSAGEKIDPLRLVERAENYIDENNLLIPNEILFTVCTADIQKDRIETITIGVGEDEEIWILSYQKIFGTPAQAEVWKRLDKFIFAEWERKDGLKLKNLIALIDSGYLSQQVYDYVRSRQTKLKYGVWAARGKGGYNVPILPQKFTWVDHKRTRLLNLGSNEAKSRLFTKLNLEKEEGMLDYPRGYIHFPKYCCDVNFFKQFAAEAPVKKRQGMIEYIVYEKTDAKLRNEAIDLMYFAIAAIQFIFPNYKKIKEHQEKQKEKLEAEKNIIGIKEEEEDEIPKMEIQPKPELTVKRKTIKRKKNFATSW